MKILAILSLLISFNSFADSSICFNEKDGVEVFVVAGGGEVKFFDLEKDLHLESIDQTLPAGRYEVGEDINEQLEHYFQEYAWVQLDPTENSGEAYFTVIGQDDSAPSWPVFESKLTCYGDAF